MSSFLDKPAKSEHALHSLIRQRWSPRAFAPRDVDAGQVRSLLAAAQWAASCFNEQPWRFIVARRSDEAEFARLLSCLAEKNQEWAKNAGLLLLSVARTTFTRNDKPNRHALHDVGLAAAQLTLQATALGLGVHQMAGFSAERARELYAIPEGFEPVAALAVGHPGNVAALDEGFREREQGERSRKPLAEIAFRGGWEKPF